MKKKVIKNKEVTTKEVINSPKIGRPKGSLNARTQDLFDIAEQMDCNPFKILLLYAKRDHEALGLPKERVVGISESGEEIKVFSISPELGQKSAKDACEYLYPKRKAIEHTGKDGEKLLTIEEFISGTNKEQS
jgi:hypothetical protein